jgi:uncharacterized protein YaeQ
VALTATLYTIEVQLSDMDRGVYETLALRVARHPSETEEYLATRVLAYALEYAEGITFSKGLDDPEEPAITVRDLTGALKVWIEIGSPDADRLHKASKASPRTVLYTHKPPHVLQRMWAGARVHKAEALELYAIPRAVLEAFAEHLEKRMTLTLSVSERHLYLDIGGTTVDGAIERFTLTAPA